MPSWPAGAVGLKGGADRSREVVGEKNELEKKRYSSCWDSRGWEGFVVLVVLVVLVAFLAALLTPFAALEIPFAALETPFAALATPFAALATPFALSFAPFCTLPAVTAPNPSPFF